MCRSIRVLHHFEPPTTEVEMHEAALQYVRKVSGLRAPPRTPAESEAFARAVAEITEATSRLLALLPSRGQPRTREGEREKARTRWTVRARRAGQA